MNVTEASNLYQDFRRKHLLNPIMRKIFNDLEGQVWFTKVKGNNIQVWYKHSKSKKFTCIVTEKGEVSIEAGIIVP